MTRKLADEYKRAGKADWAASLKADSDSMVSMMSQAVKPSSDGGKLPSCIMFLTNKFGNLEVLYNPMEVTCMPTSVSLSLGVGTLTQLVLPALLDGPSSMTGTTILSSLVVISLTPLSGLSNARPTHQTRPFLKSWLPSMTINCTGNKCSLCAVTLCFSVLARDFPIYVVFFVTDQCARSFFSLPSWLWRMHLCYRSLKTLPSRRRLILSVASLARGQRPQSSRTFLSSVYTPSTLSYSQVPCVV